MGPRVKKPRSGKAKDLPSSAEADQEIIDGGEEKIMEESESQKEVPITEVDNGGEEAPPLKKSRGRQNVKKGNLKPPAKGKAAPTADEENLDEEPEDNGTEENTDKVSSDDEETLPAKKIRGRPKRATKNEVGKVASEGDEEHKEDLDSAAPGTRKGRAKKKKVEDEPEVMPKKKERGARKNDTVDEEVVHVDEAAGTTTIEESKSKVTKREKKQPTKRGGKGKKDQDEDEKLLEEEEANEKKIENGNDVEKSESEEVQDTDGGAGKVKAAKKPARGKTAAKAADGAVNKKPVGRGKKAAKEDLTGDNDVPVDGKKLRVLVEHWELVSFLQEEYPDIDVSYNAIPPRRNSFEFLLKKSDSTEVVLWSGINKGPPRKEKFPDAGVLLQAYKDALKC